jgi:hypothetical protein
MRIAASPDGQAGLEGVDQYLGSERLILQATGLSLDAAP